MKRTFFFVMILLISSLALFSCKHEHTYEWKVTKAATCSQKGEQKGSCSCGEESYMSIDYIAHKLDENGVCSMCEKKVFNLTAVEKNLSEEVDNISNVDLVDQPRENALRFQFSLIDENESMINPPAFAEITVRNEDGENIYSETAVIKGSDYKTYYYEGNTLKKILATVMIDKDALGLSAYSTGTLTYKIYSSNYFLFEDTIAIDGLPECEHIYVSGVCESCERVCEHSYDGEFCTVCGESNPDNISFILPKAPFESQFTKDGTVYEVSVEAISVEAYGKRDFILFAEAKITSPENKGENLSVGIGYKLYDSEGRVVDSGYLYNEFSECGETVLLSAKLENLSLGKSYELIIVE